jgi:hypothetical protein
MMFGNSGRADLILVVHYPPYIKEGDQREYSWSLHIIDLSIIMDIKKWENLVWKSEKDTLKQ